MAKIDENPLPALDGPAEADPRRGDARPSARRCTPTPRGRRWPTALHDAQGGDGSGLMDLYDEYFQRQPDGTYDNSLEAFNVISCMDSADRPTVAEEDAFAAQMHAGRATVVAGDESVRTSARSSRRRTTRG